MCDVGISPHSAIYHPLLASKPSCTQHQLPLHHYTLTLGHPANISQRNMASGEGKEMNMTSGSAEGKEVNMASGEAKERDMTSSIGVGKEKNMASGSGEGKGDSVGAMYLQYRPSYGTGVYDDRQWWPWLVPAFLCACAAVFAVEMYQNNCPRNNGRSLGGGNATCVAGFLRRFAFQPLRENPLIGPSSATLEKMGALNWAKVVHQHQGWRLISSMWLHAGLIHLVINMLSLLFVGIRLEQQFGFVRVGIIYLLSGFGGSVLSALFLHNHSISVGASGPLFGLLGSMLSELFMNWTIYSNKVAAIITLVSIFVINSAVGILPHDDNFGHIGGFITGFLLGFVLLARPQFDWMGRDKLPETNQPPKYKRNQYVMWGAALFLLLVWYVVSLAMLFTGKNGNHGCHWCRYLNCVPTSSWKCSP